MGTLLVVLVLLLTAVILAVQNATTVTLSLLSWQLDASLAIVVIVCLAFGAICGVLAVLPRLYRQHHLERRLRELARHPGKQTDAIGASPPAPPRR